MQTLDAKQKIATYHRHYYVTYVQRINALVRAIEMGYQPSMNSIIISIIKDELWEHQKARMIRAQH